MRILRTALLTVAGGLLIAFILFNMTALPISRFCCPVDHVVTDYGGINPWTGEVRPLRVDIYDHTTGQVTRTHEIPENWKDRRVVPLPVGFVVGSLLTLTVISIAARRPRRATPDSAVSAA
jgi:hypothetical protein